jgi:alpha-glucosidase
VVVSFVLPLLVTAWVAGSLAGAGTFRPPSSTASDYTFIGNLQSYERAERGIDAVCEPGAHVQLRFVTPGIARITMIPPDADEDRLEETLVPAEPEPVTVDLVEEASRIVLRSDEIEVALHREPCRVEIRDRAGRVLSTDDPGMGMGWDGLEVGAWKAIAEGERFFGLGEKTGDLDKRGRRWEMWNTDDFAYEVDADPLYASIPFFVGLRDGNAYGLFLNNSYRSAFNLGAGNHRYYSFTAEGGALDYFFIHGPEIARVVERYTDLTGRTPLPPRWALGYQQSRWSYYPRSGVMRLAHTFREKRIPADVLYLDIHYMDDYRVFTWDLERFPEPQRMLAELEAMGFKVVTIVDPGVKEDPEYPIAREGLAGDHFLRYPDGEVYVGSVWPGRSYLPDFSRAETRAWWGRNLDAWLDQGVDGVWNDMNEPAVWGGTVPLEVVMGDEGGESSQKRMHNLYGLLMARATREELLRHRPNERPFVLTRAAFAGIQRYAAIWTGDNVASWEHLELAIRMMIGLGVSGVPVNGTDVGGFVGTPSPELFARWIQLGALSPFFRTHTTYGTPSQDPWSFGEEVERISRQAIELRYQMLPYLYTLFWEAHRTGAPILRPLFWHFQDDSVAYDRRWQHQFLVGDRLLAAPVTREGASVQEVYLPAGEWLELATGTVHQGGEVVVDAPLDRLPLFLRAGAIVPMEQVRQHMGEPADTLILEVFPGDVASEATLYEDDGLSLAYETGAYRLTRFGATRGEGGLTIVRSVEHDRHHPPARHVEIRVHAIERAPEAVALDGRPLPEIAPGERGEGFAHDRARRVLAVRFREAGERQEVTVR